MIVSAHRTTREHTIGVLAAYRGAAARNAIRLDDGSWLTIGALLEHAALLPTAERHAHLLQATALLRERLGEAWHDGHPTDPAPPAIHDALGARLRVYCERIEDAGAIEVADAILVAYLDADDGATELERARVEAVRARLAWKAGDLEAAAERYRRVAAAGRKLRSEELHVRALIGSSIVARLRGNYPESRLGGVRAIALAQHARLGRLASSAHHAMMVGEAVAGAFESAVEHGWQAYIYAEGNPAMEAAALGNVGQLFLEAGHPLTAAAAFRAVLERHPADRILVPALSGYANAAAALNDRSLLTTLTGQIVARTTTGMTPYDTATALLDLARAWFTVGDAHRGGEFRSRAHEIARTHGFHEIVHHADAMAPLVRATRPLTSRTEAVAGAVRELAGV